MHLQAMTVLVKARWSKNKTVVDGPRVQLDKLTEVLGLPGGYYYEYPCRVFLQK
ncbi:hypothetical protein ERICIV_03231 [Paenibacillus larvae subsp. larvae]|uniref:Uncharacterized protein n=2 Tax=Paenibacillus larvae TaxID=1464 RepID=A0A2L1U3F6_9BACL|nr:hypothetical protein [Paenibacillus larvae]AVF27441.1 hypothetical protein ERICIII_03328 [Paenibacillus larvae subsp. larvae]AVF32104.1 hypothetical protein ERICIV_03231 [Paenibacillus larvae subsp. larvae]MCY9748771.1 hypothetical protein [Paenibacillus larvae]MEC0185597.1 hypothetical protein [Paenibacillus larvae]